MKTTEPTQSEKRIAIAEHFGKIKWSYALPNKTIRDDVPSYFDSLEDCHEAENALSVEDHSKFRRTLWDLAYNPDNPDAMKQRRDYVSASASLRAEALFQVLCKPQTP